MIDSTPLPDDFSQEVESDPPENALIDLPHPGEILQTEFMQPLGLSGNALAKALNVAPSQITRLVRGRHGVSAEMSLRLGRFFRMSPAFFLNLQRDYDIRLAKRRYADHIARTIPEHSSAA